MAKTSQTIENPVTGQRILFLTSAKENGGIRWEVEWFVKPQQGKFPPEHLHPTFSEQFAILSGTAGYKLAGQEHTAQAGEVVNIPAGLAHMNPWSVSDEELHMRHVIKLAQPNLRMLAAAEDFFETLFGLAQEGKVGQDGRPTLLQFFVLVAAASPLAYLPGIPIGAQDIVIGALVRIGSWLGYKALYPQYSGVE